VILKESKYSSFITGLDKNNLRRALKHIKYDYKILKDRSYESEQSLIASLNMTFEQYKQILAHLEQAISLFPSDVGELEKGEWK